MPRGFERRALQAVVAALALIPLLTGIAGIFLGPKFLGLSAPWPVDLDSHFRFLSGVFFCVGLGFLSTVPTIESATDRFRTLAALIFAGGLARLHSMGLSGTPSTGHLIGLAMELVVVPLLVVWQAHVARNATDRTGR